MTSVKIIDFLNKLEGYKTTAKNQHWDSKKDAEHRLMEELEYTLGRYQDSIAEIYQGIHDIKIQKNKLQGKEYRFTSYDKFLKISSRQLKTFMIL